MASGVLLGPGECVKPSSPPSVALYLQFFWKPGQKKRKKKKKKKSRIIEYGQAQHPDEPKTLYKKDPLDSVATSDKNN